MTRILRVIWQKVQSLWFEIYFGIHTRGYAPPPTDEGISYSPLPYSVIFRMLKYLDMKEHDVFVDVGCGKGRVVCCVCRTPIKKVVAIELNRELLNQALVNTRRLRGKISLVEPVLKSAEDYDYEDATVVYFYNPFSARLVELVMERLFESFMRSPRLICVVYANPIHTEAIGRLNWLEKYEEWPASEFPGFGCPVSFWRSVPK